jgi:hypothetical protein
MGKITQLNAVVAVFPRQYPIIFPLNCFPLKNNGIKQHYRKQGRRTFENTDVLFSIPRPSLEICFSSRQRHLTFEAIDPAAPRFNMRLLPPATKE